MATGAVCSARSVGQQVAPGELTLGQAYASIAEPKYDLYWLGEDVAFGDYRLGSPYVCRVGCALNPDELESHYSVAPNQSDIRWAMGSNEAWLRAKRIIEAPQRSGTMSSQTIDVAGREAQLLTYFHPGGQVRLVIGVIFVDGRTVIVATAEDAPFLDPEAFVQLLQNFRSYPD